VKRPRHSGKALVAFAVTGVLLYFALRGIDWSEVGRHLRGANWFYLAAAVTVTTLGMHIRAMRWKPLLEPIAPNMPFYPRIAATSIGFAANNLLPARIGEFARAYVMGRSGKMPVSAAFASMVMERLLDGFVCVGFLFIAMAWPGFPELAVGGGFDPRPVAIGIGSFALVVGLLLSALAFIPGPTVRIAERIANRILPESFRRPFVDSLHAFLGGLGVLRRPRLLAVSVAWVLFQWLFLALSFWLAFLAFGIDAPGYLGAIFLQSVIALAVSIPSAPGFFGTYHAAARYGLALWGVSGEQALSFAIGLHLGGYITVTLLGLYYATRLNVSWKDLKAAEVEVEEAVERDAGLSPPAGRPPRDA
jgi:glycosyltransferase 2 family protein